MTYLTLNNLIIGVWCLIISYHAWRFDVVF